MRGVSTMASDSCACSRPIALHELFIQPHQWRPHPVGTADSFSAAPPVLTVFVMASIEQRSPRESPIEFDFEADDLRIDALSSSAGGWIQVQDLPAPVASRTSGPPPLPTFQRCLEFARRRPATYPEPAGRSPRYWPQGESLSFAFPSESSRMTTG